MRIFEATWTPYRSSFALATALVCSASPAEPAVTTGIADLVAEVLQVNVEAHLLALEGERSTDEQLDAAATYIGNELSAYGYDVILVSVGDSENVIATLYGTETPERVFIVGAHYDTVAGTPGADDNASGVAGMLEIARVLADENCASTIKFVAFTYEETGLLGSKAYAAELFEDGVQVIGMVSLDMIGYTCITEGCQPLVESAPPCLEVSEPVETLGDWIGAIANTDSSFLVDRLLAAASAYVPNLKIEWGKVACAGKCFPDSRRSDQAPFWDHGYPAIAFNDGGNRNPNYHLSSDTFSTLDTAFATDVTRATLALAVSVAGKPQPVQVSVKATLTADNAYVFGHGSALEMTTAVAAVYNSEASEIFSCATGPETYSVTVPSDGYLYVVAWSDDVVSQGVLGQFWRPGRPAIFSGHGDWEVYATGIDFDGWPGPDLAQINAEIALASPTAGATGSTSATWVATASLCGEGRLAVGETNALAAGSGTCTNAFEGACSSKVGHAARWMWYEEEIPSGCSFYPGGNHAEFLIFRLPVASLPRTWSPFDHTWDVVKMAL